MTVAQFRVEIENLTIGSFIISKFRFFFVRKTNNNKNNKAK